MHGMAHAGHLVHVAEAALTLAGFAVVAGAAVLSAVRRRPTRGV
jgi:hypothetical protein